jgi:predicted nucleotidyltransferase
LGQGFGLELRERIVALFHDYQDRFYEEIVVKGLLPEARRQHELKVKKYFYVLRPVLASLWIKAKNTLPPVEFETLVATLLIEGSLKQAIETLLQRKKVGEELDTEARILVINEFLEQEIRNIEAYLQSIEKPQVKDVQVFDRIFQDALPEVWGNKGSAGCENN